MKSRKMRRRNLQPLVKKKEKQKRKKRNENLKKISTEHALNHWMKEMIVMGLLMFDRRELN